MPRPVRHSKLRRASLDSEPSSAVGAYWTVRVPCMLAWYLHSEMGIEIYFSILQRKAISPNDFKPRPTLRTHHRLSGPLQHHRDTVRLDLHSRRPQRLPPPPRPAGPRARADLPARLLPGLAPAQGLATATFTDQHPPRRDNPVAPAQRSPQADAKAPATRRRRQPATPLPRPARPPGQPHPQPGPLPRRQHRRARARRPTPDQRRAFDLLRRPIPLTATA